MPTTKAKNLFYRVCLPLMAPPVGKDPIHRVNGHPLLRQSDFVRLLKKHHIQGSATLLTDRDSSCLILTHSPLSGHHAEENTYFRVASITKVATALVAMILCDRGLLNLDSPIAEVFPVGHVIPPMEKITLRHLLSHTAGISDPPQLENELLQEKTVDTILADCIFSEPGKQFRYSNLGFGLIGCMMEAVCRSPVSEIFQETLFSPLGMEATLDGSRLDPERIMPVSRIFPWCHQELKITPLGKAPLSSPDPLRHYGHTAGSLYITVDSLYCMMTVLRDGNPDLISESSREAMFREHASYGALSPTLSYGLGLLFIHDRSLSSSRIVGHQGFAYGCADGAFFEEKTGRMMITLNGGCSEARTGRLGLSNRDFLRFAFQKELPLWS